MKFCIKSVLVATQGNDAILFVPRFHGWIRINGKCAKNFWSLSVFLPKKGVFKFPIPSFEVCQVSSFLSFGQIPSFFGFKSYFMMSAVFC